MQLNFQFVGLFVPHFSLTTIHNCIVVSTGYGVLHRVLWDGQFDSHLTIKLQSIQFSTDLTPQSKGLYIYFI